MLKLSKRSTGQENLQAKVPALHRSLWTGGFGNFKKTLIIAFKSN